MGYVDTLTKVALGAGAGVVAVTALPIFGVAGTITATGVAVGSLVGAAAGLADAAEKQKESEEQPKSLT